MTVSRALAPSRNRAARSHSSPSSSFMRMSHSSAPLALRIPPAGLNPTAWPVSSRYSRIWRARFHRRPELLEPLREGIEAGGEACGDGGDRDTGARQRREGRRHVAVIDAHRTDHDAELGRAQRLDEVLAHRVLGLRAEPQHVARGVVALERREVDAGDGAEQPGGLPFLFDGAPGGDGGGAPLHRRAAHSHRADPVEVERDARVAPGLGRHAERPLVLLFGFHRPASNLRDWRLGAAGISSAASLSHCRAPPCDPSRVAAPPPADVRAEAAPARRWVAARVPRWERGAPSPSRVAAPPPADVRAEAAPARRWVAARVPRWERGAPFGRGARWERRWAPAAQPVRAAQLAPGAQREQPQAWAARRVRPPAPVVQRVRVAPRGRKDGVAPRRVPPEDASRAGA